MPRSVFCVLYSVFCAALLAACAPTADPVSGSLAVQGTRVANQQAEITEYTIATQEAIRAAQTEIELQNAANAAEAERQRLAQEAQALALSQAQVDAQIAQLARSQTVAATATPAAQLAASSAYSVTVHAEAEARAQAAEAWRKSEEAKANGSALAWGFVFVAIVTICAVLAIAAVVWGYLYIKNANHAAQLHRQRLDDTVFLQNDTFILLPGFGPAIVREDRLLPASAYLGPTANATPISASSLGEVRVRDGGLQYVLPKVTLSPAQIRLRDFIGNCLAINGAESTKLPSADTYQKRYGGSKDAWQDPVNQLKPSYLYGTRTAGTVLIHPQYPTLYALHTALEQGHILPASEVVVVA